MRFARTNLIPFPASERSHSNGTVDVSYAALPLLRRLSETLNDAGRFIQSCRRWEERKTRKQRRWGVPPLFFFNAKLQKEWEDIRPVQPVFPEPYTAFAAKRDPKGAAAWTILPDLLADAMTVLYGSRLVRRTARAVPGLKAGAEALANLMNDCRDCVDLLAMPEDEPILVLHPAARVGARVRTRGIANIHEFHVLLADAVGMTFPGSRPTAASVSAYRGLTIAMGDPAIASARFQLFRPSALQADGTLPQGFTGTDDWLWGPEPLAAIPRVAGERVLLLDQPVFDMKWEAIRRFPFAPDRVEILEFLDEAAVSGWMNQFLGVNVSSPAVKRKAA